MQYKVISAYAPGKKKVFKYGQTVNSQEFEDAAKMATEGFLEFVEADAEVVQIVAEAKANIDVEEVPQPEQPQEAVLDESDFFGKKSKKSK